MKTKKQETDLVRQVREAFDTIILDDRFLSNEQRQLELLDMLRRHLDRTGAAVDDAIRRGHETVTQPH